MRLILPANAQRLLFWAIALGSAASVALAAMPVVSRLSQRDQIWRAAVGAAQPKAPTPERVSLQAVLELAPFGQAVVIAAPADTPDASTAPMDLALQGVVVGAAPGSSMAIISLDGAAPANFRQGDAVTGGIVVQTIEADHVMLTIDGDAQRLAFQAATTLAAEAGTDEPAAADAFLKTLIPAATGAADPESPETIRAALLRNPRAVLDRYGIAETDHGYLITDAAPPDLLRIGLQQGDTITALNGEAVAGVAADGALFDRVAGSGSAQITLTRDGATLNLTVALP